MNLIIKRCRSSQARKAQGRYAQLKSAKGSVKEAFASALQAHEESGDNILTEEDISEIIRVLGIVRDDHTGLKVPLSEEGAKSPDWRKGVSLYKKLITIGTFHVTKEHLESIRRLEREVKPDVVVVERRDEDRFSKDRYYFLVIFIFLIGMEVLRRLFFREKSGTNGTGNETSHDDLNDDLNDLRSSTGDEGHVDEA